MLITTLTQLNKAFHKYFLYKRLEFQVSIENSRSIAELVNKIIQENNLKNKNNDFIASQLSKYWKEPMAWH